MNGATATGTGAAHDPISPAFQPREPGLRGGLVEAPALVVVAAAMASGGLPPPAAVGWLWLTAAGAFASARAIVRLADLTGSLAAEPGRGRRRWAAAAVAMGGTLLLLVAALHLERPAIALAPLAVGVLAVPSFTQGDTLGGRAARAAAWALCPLGSWTAVRGSAEGPAWLLAAGAGLAAFTLGGGVRGWEPTAGTPSERDSRGAGQGHPSSSRVPVARGLLAAAALWLMAGWAAGRGWPYFAALAAAVALLGRACAPGPDGLPATRRLASATRWATLLLLAACLLDVAG